MAHRIANPPPAPAQQELPLARATVIRRDQQARGYEDDTDEILCKLAKVEQKLDLILKAFDIKVPG